MSQLTLPAPAIRRILERSPSLLIHRRELKPQTYEVHNAYRVQRNASHTRSGMVHLVEDAFCFVVEISACSRWGWDEIDLRLVRAAGYKTTQEFRDAWPYKPSPVFAHVFQVAEDARYLHRKIARGYTRNPSLGLEQALDPADLERYAATASYRHSIRKREEDAAKSRQLRVAELERRAAAGEDEARRMLFVIDQRLDKAHERRSRSAI